MLPYKQNLKSLFYLVYFEKSQQIIEGINDQATKLIGHQWSCVGEKFLNLKRRERQ